MGQSERKTGAVTGGIGVVAGGSFSLASGVLPPSDGTGIKFNLP